MNFRQPSISVIIPAYRAASRIRETLDSVFAQTISNFEIVLVDDGSPDAEALERATQGYDERLTYIRQENQGPSGARNTAIRAARGKYIACLDSDDIYLPEHLAGLLSMLESGLDLVYADVRITRNGVYVGKSSEREPQHPPVTFEKLITEACRVPTSSMMARRQAMLDAGLFDEDYRRCEDFDLWLRMSFQGARMDFLPQVGVEHRLLDDALSADSSLMKQGRIAVYKKTLATLPLSLDQKRLVEGRIALTEGLSEMDLVKRHVREGRYSEARLAAGKAAALLQDLRSRSVALALHIAPWAVRGYLNRQDAQLARKRNLNANFASAELTGVAQTAIVDPKKEVVRG